MAHEFVLKCHPADHDVMIAKAVAAAEVAVVVEEAVVAEAVAAEIGTGTF